MASTGRHTNILYHNIMAPSAAITTIKFNNVDNRDQ